MIAIAGLLLSSLANQFLLWYGIEIRPRKKGVREEEVFPFVRNVVRIVIVVLFAVFVLQRLGFDTTAIITGLGIGGLAVALALQDTLANFFGGVHILVDKPFREDDYIKLESGIEGTVVQIGWRTTRLITPAQNEIIVPNSKLSGAILENFSSPRDLSGVHYTIGVDYKEDIDSVEMLITDVLKKVGKKNPLMEESSIWVRFDSFGEYSLNFKFGYNVKGYINRWAVLKEINRELFYAFRKSNINIPFPVRVIYEPPIEETKGKKK
jgi:small-conductance mechanosensitive channel